MMKKPALSAQVVLAPSPADDASAVASNIDALRPEPGVASRIAKAFKDRGFQTGPVVGNSFSIEGTASRFRKLFGATVRPRDDGGVTIEAADGQELSALPLDALPDDIRAVVSAIVFSEPPDFGPGVMP